MKICNAGSHLSTYVAAGEDNSAQAKIFYRTGKAVK